MMNSSNKRILVLDGGMGTTLEAQGHSVHSTRLWASELVISNPSAIVKVHEDYLKAGADIIQTATYQLKPDNLRKHLNCQEEESSRVLCSAVGLAKKAIDLVQPKQGSIALSFSAYGSTIRQEYSGLYPPPYGPSTITSSFPNKLARTEAEQTAIQLLAEHHLEKLRAFSSDEQTWRQVEWISFETVPVLHEVRGIRLAMAICNSELKDRYGQHGTGDNEREWWDKRYWIANVFFAGQLPQFTLSGEHAKVPELLDALLGGPEESVPDGIGINCTNPAYLPSLSDEYTALLPRYKCVKKPWLVLYPDGGQVFDPVQRKWVVVAESPKTAEEWANSVGALAKTAAESKEGKDYVWEGVIVGGCCKSSFPEIAALRRYVDSHLC